MLTFSFPSLMMKLPLPTKVMRDFTGLIIILSWGCCPGGVRLTTGPTCSSSSSNIILKDKLARPMTRTAKMPKMPSRNPHRNFSGIRPSMLFGIGI